MRIAVWVIPLVAGACGPVSSSARILAAQVEVDAAAGANADAAAAYEMTKAREYLHKSREEQGYSDYEVSVRLAEQAAAFGEQAKQKAREHPTEVPNAQPTLVPGPTVAPTAVPPPPPPVVAPGT